MKRDQKTKAVEIKDVKQKMVSDIDCKLMKMNAKPYKRMLVPLESDKPWFEQVLTCALTIGAVSEFMTLLYTQSKSEFGSVSLSLSALEHLTLVGEKLMQREVELYEKGVLFLLP